MPRPFAPLLLIPVLALGCDRDAMYETKSLTSSIKEVWKDCDPNEVSFLTAKHGIQTAFENCGANPFTYFSWSPDGVHIYFQLAFEGFIMNGEEKTIRELPKDQASAKLPEGLHDPNGGLFRSCQGEPEAPVQIEETRNLLPVANAAWLDNGVLAVPIGATEEEDAPRIGLFNLSTNDGEYIALGDLRDPKDLQSSGTNDSVLFTALDPSENRGIYRASFSAKTIEPAFVWHKGQADSFTYAPKPDLVAWGHDKIVKIAKGETGEILYTFEDATRGSIHADGELIALETEGAPISTFKPKSAGDDSPQAQRRQDAREKKWQNAKPDWVPSELIPPALDFFDSKVGKRYRLTDIHGHSFQWYPGHSDYGSFVLWGLEKKELKRNVALSALAARVLRLRDKTELPKGMEIVGETPSPISPE